VVEVGEVQDLEVDAVSADLGVLTDLGDYLGRAAGQALLAQFVGRPADRVGATP
jgi:hypothetical protein